MGDFYGYENQSWEEIFLTLKNYSTEYIDKNISDIEKMDIIADY